MGSSNTREPQNWGGGVSGGRKRQLQILLARQEYAERLPSLKLLPVSET